MQKIILRTKKEKRKLRVRKKIFGVPEKLRLSVFRSNKYIYGQIIDDTTGKTLVGLPLSQIKELHEGNPKLEAAKKTGLLLGELAKKKKIEGIVFDRNGYKYHGRVKVFADGAREGGLKF